MGRTVVVGLDLGQRQDPTALCVVESSPIRTGRTTHVGHEPPWGQCYRCSAETEDLFEVRDIGRLELGTRYRQVARHVAEVVEALNAAGMTPYVHVDSTGGGIPAFEDLQDGLAGVDCRLTAVTFAGAAKLKGSLGSPKVTLPKEYGVQRVQALLQSGRIRMPDTARTRALAEELRTYEVRVTESERRIGLQAGAFKTGAHDDLATALMLATLFDPSGQDATYLPLWGGPS